MAERIPDAIRTRRAIRDTDFGNCGVRRREVDADNLGIRERRYRDSLRGHDRGCVVAINNHGLIARWNTGSRAEMEYLAVTRFTRCVARLSTRYGWNRHTTIRDRNSLGDAAVGIRPYRDNNSRRCTARCVRPRKGRLTGRGARATRCAYMGYSHLVFVVVNDHSAGDGQRCRAR